MSKNMESYVNYFSRITKKRRGGRELWARHGKGQGQAANLSHDHLCSGFSLTRTLDSDKLLNSLWSMDVCFIFVFYVILI